PTKFPADAVCVDVCLFTVLSRVMHLLLSLLFPYPTLFRSELRHDAGRALPPRAPGRFDQVLRQRIGTHVLGEEIMAAKVGAAARSEEHTSELQHQIISYAVICLKKTRKAHTHT